VCVSRYPASEYLLSPHCKLLVASCWCADVAAWPDVTRFNFPFQ